MRSAGSAACLVFACACSQSTTFGNGAPLSPPITGKYCTTWTQGNFAQGNVPINIACLQPNGQWQDMGGFPESPPSSQYSYFVNASLNKAANGDILLSYMRWIYPTPFDGEIMVARYHSGSGWSQLESTGANISGGKELPTYSQFGGQVFDFLGTPYMLWTSGSQGGTLSSPSGNAWNQLPVAASLNTCFRHPEALVSADGSTTYLHYGEPTPTVWKFDGTTLSSLGGPTVNPAAEWTLYTSLAEWNGQLVLAYTTNNMPLQNGNWSGVTDLTKIALYNGSSWSLISTGIQDTPGHDGAIPFLFTVGGTLYVMYADYTTNGLPTVNYQIAFRFRVKQWTGSSWTPIGSESDLVYYSQRIEFLNDAGTVLVHVVQPDAAGTGSQEVVMRWNGGQFGYEGGVIRSFPNVPYAMVYRPGAIIPYQ